MMRTKPHVSAVVISRNTRDLLEQSLAWLGKICPEIELSVSVVENASSDGSLELVQRKFPEVRVLSEGKNLGYARSVNLALRELGGPFYLILNGDCRIRSDEVGRLVEIYSGLESPGVLGPRQVDEAGRLGLTWGKFPTPWTEWQRGRQQRRLRQERRHGGPRSEKGGPPRRVDWVSGSCWLVHGGVAKAAGPLDEKYFLYFEDIDWCAKVRKAGFRIYYVPDVTAIHADGRSAAVEPEAADLAYRTSQLYFASKHWSAPARAVLRAYLTAKFRWQLRVGTGVQKTHAEKVLEIVRAG